MENKNLTAQGLIDEVDKMQRQEVNMKRIEEQVDKDIALETKQFLKKKERSAFLKKMHKKVMNKKIKQEVKNESNRGKSKI